jgi:hypothetical protein
VAESRRRSNDHVAIFRHASAANFASASASVVKAFVAGFTGSRPGVTLPGMRPGLPRGWLQAL